MAFTECVKKGKLIGKVVIRLCCLHAMRPVATKGLRELYRTGPTRQRALDKRHDDDEMSPAGMHAATRVGRSVTVCVCLLRLNSTEAVFLVREDVTRMLRGKWSRFKLWFV